MDAADRIARIIAQEINASPAQVVAATGLLDGGATVPFVARYRKEVTGGLDDTQLRNLSERLAYLRELEARRLAIRDQVQSQGKLTEDLARAIAGAETKAALEDIYLPFKPKRRTKAMIARENGLEPLLRAIQADRAAPPETLAAAYLTETVPEVKAALDGARDILVEELSENAPCWAGCANSCRPRPSFRRVWCRARSRPAPSSATISPMPRNGPPFPRIAPWRSCAASRKRC